MLLLDTNVVSELRKVRGGKADACFTRWIDGVEAADLYVSVITIHEIEVGILRTERKDAKQGALLRAWLKDRVLPVFAGRILPVDTAIALRSAALHVPDPRPLADGLIAATAQVHGMTVVTRNIADFASFGVPLFNPWIEQQQ